MKAEYGEVKLSEIELGKRRREDYGDLNKLVTGIHRVGLLHPLIVQRINGSSRYEIVAGGRRFKALQMMKWRKPVPVRLVETLTDEELREIELQENDNRKDFTARERKRTFAASKRMVEDAQQAKAVMQQSSITTSSKGGPKPANGVRQTDVAEALGVNRMTIAKAEQHVETAERFPFMQASQWRQSHVLAVREHLEELPEEERDDAAGVLQCAKILDPATAVELVQNIAKKKPAERQKVYELSKSDDPRDKSLALTTAAELPPVSDPRLGTLETALDALRRGSKPYPSDPLTPKFIEEIEHLKALREQVKAVSYDARRDAKKAAIQ